MPEARQVDKKVLGIGSLAAKYGRQVRLLEHAQSADRHADQQEIEKEMDCPGNEVEESVPRVSRSRTFRGKKYDQTDDKQYCDEHTDVGMDLQHERLLGVIHRHARHDELPDAKHHDNQQKHQPVQGNMDRVVTGWR